MPKSLTQRIITAFVSDEIAADMERHSKLWIVRCKTCGHERSIWELGGIKWKAYGSSLTFLGCPPCGKRRVHVISKREESAT